MKRLIKWLEKIGGNRSSDHRYLSEAVDLADWEWRMNELRSPNFRSCVFGGNYQCG